MTRLRALDPVRHAGLRVHRLAGAAQRRLISLGRAEIALAAADMPLCFAKDAQTGRFDLVALLGLVEPVNLFVAADGYRATYQPRAAALTAFRLDAAGMGGLAIDEDDPSLGTRGEPILNTLPTWHGALEQVIADIAAARALAEGYARRGVLRPLVVTLTMADGHDQVLDGLYTVADAALATLDDAAVLAMHHADELAPAAVLAASLAQVERLRQLHNARFPETIATARLTIGE